MHRTQYRGGAGTIQKHKEPSAFQSLPRRTGTDQSTVLTSTMMDVALLFVGHGNPAPSSWHKQFLLLAQQYFGANYKPLLMVRSWYFGCRKTKNQFETRL